MTGRPLILHFAILKRKMFTSKRKWNMTAIWWWRSGIQKYAARTGIITDLREKPTSSLAWHVWVIAAIKALIEVRISRNKAGSCQWAAEKKGFDASSRPPFRFHSFKPVLRRQQIYFQFPLWCGGGGVMTSSWKASVGLLGRTRGPFFAGWFSGMEKELKQQKSACGPPCD